MSDASLPFDVDDRGQWRRIIDDASSTTYNGIATELEQRLDLSTAAAFDVIDDAMAAGRIDELDISGSFPHLRVVEPFDASGGSLPDAPTTRHYRDLRYTETTSGDFGDATAIGSWMPTCAGMGGKLPYAKYHDHPDLANYDPSDPGSKDPRKSWPDPSNWSTFDDVDKRVRMDPELFNRAFILQRESDPYRDPADPFLLADGDNVIDPETGEPIPEFVGAIEVLVGGEPTFQELSESETGVHAMLRGALPDGTKQNFIQLREEPIDGYDKPPMLELYDGKTVNVFTGNKIAGTPNEYADVDETGLRRLLHNGTNAHPNVLTAAEERRGDGASGANGDGSGSMVIGAGDVDGVPGLSIDPDVGPGNAPDDLPKCYRRALTARYDDVNMPGIGNHGVNLYASNLAMAAGYSVDEATEHFAMFTPDGDPAKFKERTTRNVLSKDEKKIANGDLLPVSESALRSVGLFDRTETCGPDCPIHGDDESGGYVALLPDVDTGSIGRRGDFGPLTAQYVDTDGDEQDPDDDTGPSIADVRARTADEIIATMHGRGTAVVDGIMGGGKTYNAIGANAGLDEAGTYLSGRKDLYQQATDYAAEHGIDESDICVLPTPEDCPVWTGEYGGEWRDRVYACYAAGATMSTIHGCLDGIPCCEDDRVCPYREMNQYDPNDYLLLIGHHKHGHLPQVTAGRHVIIDEDPQSAFLTRLGADRLRRGVNAFLSLDDSPALDGFDDVLRARHDPDDRRKALRWYDETNHGEGFDFEADEQNAVRFVDAGYHAYAPHAVYAILTAEPVDDTHGLYEDGSGPDRYEWEKASLPGIGNDALLYTTSGRFPQSNERDDYYVEFQTPPDQSIRYARSLVALDGTPLIDTWSDGRANGRVAEWELAIGRPLTHRRVLTDDERAAFLGETMGHCYIQTSPGVRPYSGERWRDPERDAALLAKASNRYLDGDPWDVVISSKGAADTFRDLGFNDPDGVDGLDRDRPLARWIDHRGAVRGSDAYAECRTGALIGSAHHGNHEIGRRAAWLGAQIRHEGRGNEKTYGPTGDAVLEQMRELDTAQCLLRIGRGERGRGALVLIDSSRYPEWIPVVNRDEPGDVSEWSNGERAVRDAVAAITDGMTIDAESGTDGAITADGGMFRTDAVLDHVGETPQHARRVLQRHADRGLLDKRQDPDDGRRKVWVDTGLGDLDDIEAITVDLPALADRDRDEADADD